MKGSILRTLKGSIVFFVFITLTSCTQNDKQAVDQAFADRVLTNGEIYTVNEKQTWVKELQLKMENHLCWFH
jgi:hypothetical protein